MIIGVDLDEVLADIMEPLNLYHNTEYGTSFRREDYVEYGLTKIWNVSWEEAMKRVYDFYRSPEFELLNPIPGAKDSLRLISQKNSLYIITSRPLEFHHKTENWINKH